MLVPRLDTGFDVLGKFFAARRFLLGRVQNKHGFGQLRHVDDAVRVGIFVDSEFHHSASEVVERHEADPRILPLLNSVEVVSGIILYRLWQVQVVFLALWVEVQRFSRSTHNQKGVIQI